MLIPKSTLSPVWRMVISPLLGTPPTEHDSVIVNPAVIPFRGYTGIVIAEMRLVVAV